MRSREESLKRLEEIRLEYKELGLRLGAMRARLEQWKMELKELNKKGA